MTLFTGNAIFNIFFLSAHVTYSFCHDLFSVGLWFLFLVRYGYFGCRKHPKNEV